MQPAAYCLNRNFEPDGPLHFQLDRHYLLYALEGTLRLETNGLQWTLPPARAALVRAGHPFTVTVLSKLTSASVLFSPDFTEIPRHNSSVFEMPLLARELVMECRNWGLEDAPLSGYANDMFKALARVVQKLALSPSKLMLPKPKSQRLIDAVKLTEELVADEPTFTEIAIKTNQSPRALARRFEAEMGMTWRKVIRHIRIMKAVESLASTNLPVTEIALSVGYSSISGFNAAFREMLSMSPTEYRASLNT